MMLAGLVVSVPFVVGDSLKSGGNFEGIARINSQRLENDLRWLKSASKSEGQLLIDLAARKLDKLSDRLDAIKEQVDKKLTPEQKNELKALKNKIAAQVKMLRDMTPEAPKAWREKIKFKFDQLPQEIMLFSKKIESTIPEESVAEFKEIQEKFEKFVQWLKDLPGTDKEAIRQVLSGKVDSLEKRVGILKKINRAIELEKIKEKIENFKSHVKDMAIDVKQKAIELYEMAIKALRTGKKQA